MYAHALTRARARVLLRMAGSEGECVKVAENGRGCALDSTSPGVSRASLQLAQDSLAHNRATDLRTTCQTEEEVMMVWWIGESVDASLWCVIAREPLVTRTHLISMEEKNATSATLRCSERLCDVLVRSGCSPLSRKEQSMRWKEQLGKSATIDDLIPEDMISGRQ